MSKPQPTPERVNRLCAEMDGWTFKPSGDDKDGNTYSGYFYSNDVLPDIIYPEDLTYTTSYDAIIPLIQQQDEQTLDKLAVFLCEDMNLQWPTGTPLQLAVALCKAKGLIP